MSDWSEKLVREVIWKALDDFIHELATLPDATISERRQSLTAREQLSTPPLIRFTGVDVAAVFVGSSWIDGCSDWWVDNHPIVVSAERQSTWNNGNFGWPNTTLNRDHFWSHGTTVNDIFPAGKFWLSWQWSEG
jgi:hypothetical protein